MSSSLKVSLYSKVNFDSFDRNDKLLCTTIRVVGTYIGFENRKRIRILFFCPIFILYFIWLSIWTDALTGKVCVHVGRRDVVVVVVVAVAVVVVIVVAREEPQ